MPIHRLTNIPAMRTDIFDIFKPFNIIRENVNSYLTTHKTKLKSLKTFELMKFN